jgi:hypothetical protein
MKVIKDFRCKVTKKLYKKGMNYQGDRGDELASLGYVEKEQKRGKKKGEDVDG